MSQAKQVNKHVSDQNRACVWNSRVDEGSGRIQLAREASSNIPAFYMSSKSASAEMRYRRATWRYTYARCALKRVCRYAPYSLKTFAVWDQLQHR